MKIAQITPVYPPRIGGIGSVAQEYAQSLSKEGNQVVVFTPQYSHLASPPAKGEVACRSVATPMAGRRTEGVAFLKPWYKWGNAALIPQLIWKLKDFDVLHLHYPFYGGAESVALASLIWQIPLVITYHMKPVASGWQEWIFKVYRWLVEPIIFFISKYICVSSIDYAKACGLQTSKLVELPFSIDTNFFHPADDNFVREKYKIAKSAKLIIFVGGLDDAHYFKGLDVLIGACSSLGKDIDWRLLIIGDGNKRPEFEAMSREMKINERVYFAGRVDSKDLPKYYNASDIHVLPAINRCEAFGLVTLEAAASGIPSIVSDLPGVRTLVKNRETGIIVKPSDSADLAIALKFLLEKDELRKNMGKSARTNVESEYSKGVIFGKLKEIYKSVL